MPFLIFAGLEGDMLEVDGQTAVAGEPFEVSDERAAELIADPQIGVYPAPNDELHRLKRAELDSLASSAGLNPADYHNRDVLISALQNLNVNPPAATGEGQDQNASPQEA